MKSFNDLYLDYEYEEYEVKIALQSVINDEKIAGEAAKIYQMGRAQDVLYAEQQLARGAIFNTVQKTIASNIKKRAKARPEFDTTLRKALMRAGRLPDLEYSYEAHHIVAKGAKRARFAVEILQALGVDVDDLANGLFLPADEKAKRKGAWKNAYIHNTVHTNVYYANVNLEIVSVFERNQHKDDGELRQDIIDKLGEIAGKLRNGTYPLYHYMPGAEVYDTGA